MTNTSRVIKAGYKIAEGPSKFDLMNSLFKKDEVIMFTIGRSDSTKFQIHFKFVTLGITTEDGSKERWIIDGNFFTEAKNEGSVKMRLYYDSRTRTGVVLIGHEITAN